MESFEIYFKYLVGLIWTSDLPVAKACIYTGQQNRKTKTNIHALSGIRTHDFRVQAIKAFVWDMRPLGPSVLVTTYIAVSSTQTFYYVSYAYSKELLIKTIIRPSHGYWWSISEQFNQWYNSLISRREYLSSSAVMSRIKLLKWTDISDGELQLYQTSD
jgi:hypothetical protein